MNTIYLDESGFTGEDLLNQDQPVFALASLCLAEDECSHFRQFYFGRVRANELKFVSLARSPEQQSMVTAFLSALAQNNDALKAVVCHKPYALVGRMVDWLAETATYAAGLNLYHGYENKKLTNMLFFAMPPIVGKEMWDDLLLSFQTMIREQSQESIISLTQCLDRPYPPEVELPIALLRRGHSLLAPMLPNPQVALELTVTCVRVLLAHWRKDLDGEITLVHDQSSPMAEDAETWKGLQLTEDPPYYDQNKMQYPLDISNVTSEDSRNRLGLQLADVAVGALGRVFRWIANNRTPYDPFADRLSQIILPRTTSYVTWHIWPELPGEDDE